ncbi:MAG: MFS transporter [Spirochaetaceae bacterium]|jgi:predicted MFS family arabinose efflux permease|nr:MFS transporter [Spirochaetaceae bacterium]
MKNSFIFIVGAAFCFIGFSIFLFINKNNFSLKPWESKRYFDSIYYLTGNKDRLALIEDAHETILVLDANGNILTKLLAEGGPKSFTSAERIQLDEENNIYVLDFNFGSPFEVNFERVVKFSPKGEFISEIYFNRYINNDFHMDKGRTAEISYYGGEIYVVMLNENGFTLESVRTDGSNHSELILAFPYPHAQRDLMYFDINASKRMMAFSTKSGAIKQITFEGKYTYELPVQEDEIHCIWNVVTDNRNNIFYTDLATGEIVFVDVERQLQMAMLTLAKGEAYYSFTLDCVDETVYASIRSRIFIKAPGDSFKSYNSCQYTEKETLVRKIIFAASIVDALLLLFLVVMMIKGARKIRFSSNTRIILSTSAFVLVGAIISAILIINEMTLLYKKNALNSLQNVAKIMAASIDSGMISRLNSPAQYDSKEFLEMKEKIKALFKEASFSGQKIYQSIQIERDGIMYAINDVESSLPAFYPYAIYEDEEDAKYVYENKQYKDMEFSTFTGFWLSTAGPLLDKYGNVVGILESGTELTSLQSDMRRIILGTLLIVVSATIVFLFVIIEFTVIRNAYQKNKTDFLNKKPLSYRLENLKAIILYLENVYKKAMASLAGENLDYPLFKRVIYCLKRTYTKDLRRSDPRAVFRPELLRAAVFLQYFICNLECAVLPIYSRKLYVPMFDIPYEILVAMPMTTEVVFTAIAFIIIPSIIGVVGLKRINIFSAVSLLVGNVLCFLAEDVSLLVIGHAFTGFSTGSLILVLNTMIAAQKSTEMVNSGFANLNVALFAGVNVGLIMGSIFAQFFPYRIVYVFATAAALLQIVLMAFSVGSKLVNHIYNIKYTRPRVLNKRFVMLKFFFRPAVLASLFLLLMPYLISLNFIYYFMPVFGMENGLTESNVGQLMLLNGLFAILFGTSLCKWASERTSSKNISIVVVLLNIAAIALFAFNPTVPTLIFTVFLFAIVNIFSQTNIQTHYTTLYNDMPDVPSMRALSVYSTVENVSAALGPMVFSYILSTNMSKNLIVFAGFEGVCLVLFAVISIFGKKTSSRRGA